MLLPFRDCHLHLQGGGKMDAVNGIIPGDENRPFEAVFKLSHIAGPVVCEQKVYGRGGNTFYGLLKLLRVFLHKVV